MLLAKYAKIPADDKRYQIDYTDWLDTSEQVVSTVFNVENVTTPPLVVHGVQVLPGGKGVQYYVSGGLDGQTYEVEAVMTTNSAPAQTRKDELVFVVREI